MLKDMSQTVTKALRLLDCFSDTEELGITELAEIMGAGKTVIARLVGSLEECGYLRQNPVTKKYRLGMKLMYLGNLVRDRNEIIPLVEPYLRELAREFQLTTHLSARDGSGALILSKVAMGPIVYMNSRAGSTLPIHGCAMGKCLLAFDKPEVLEEFLASGKMKRFTEKTIVDKNEFYRECQKIRAQGYGYDDEESNLGLCCLAVPLMDKSGKVIAAMSVSGQSQFIEKNRERILDRLMKAQREIMGRL